MTFYDYDEIDTPFFLEPPPLDICVKQKGYLAIDIDAFVAVSVDDRIKIDDSVPFDRMKKSSTMPMK